MHARRFRASFVVGLVMLVCLILAPGTARAQDPPQVGITVGGVGKASAPADTARLQMVFSTGDVFEAMPVEEDATPATDDVDMAAALAPVVDALMAEGVADDTITVVVSPISGDRFGRGGSAGRIDFSVSDPTRESLNALLAAANTAAEEADLSLGEVGAVYELDDCAAVEREARQAAIDDARARAEVQAELLGVQIGPITAAHDSPYFGLVGPAPCGFIADEFISSSGYGVPVTLPSYDPGAEPEIEVYVLLTLTFAIAQG